MVQSSMLPTLIDRSPDLRQLRNEGYEIEVRGSHLLMHHVPYVSETRSIRYGILISNLRLENDATATPDNHIAYFVGSIPHTDQGESLRGRLVAGERFPIDEELVADYQFSRKPEPGYSDYHHKMTTYERFLSRYAQRIDPNVTAKTFEVIEDTDEDSPFVYRDTASSRVGIAAATAKLKMDSVVIVGLGGTGSYILDQVAKTPVREIHLYDGDTFGQHNAFRSPGAASIETLQERLSKAEYLRGIYSAMHSGIHTHGHITESNIDDLRPAGFVFLAIDSGQSRALIADRLEEFGTPFIDVGMGVEMNQEDSQLLGVVRTVLSTSSSRERARSSLPLAQGNNVDLYSRNIQVADLNMMNASLAIIRWKKFLGFYADQQDEHKSVYQTPRNSMFSETGE